MAEAGLELMLVPMPHSLFLRSGVAGKRAAGVGEQAPVTLSIPFLSWLIRCDQEWDFARATSQWFVLLNLLGKEKSRSHLMAQRAMWGMQTWP